MISVQLLGPVRLVATNVSAAIRGRFPRSVLVTVALSHPHPVTDDRLVETLWGFDAPESFEAALRVHVSSLRKQLRPHGLDVDRIRGGGYVLAGELSVDVTVMRSRWQSIRAEEQAGEANDLRSLLDLWKGESVADLRRSTYGDELAASLDRDRYEIRMAYFGVLAETGHGSSVVNELFELHREDELDADVVKLLARVLADERRLDRALRLLARHRQALIELGLNADPGIGQLETALLQQNEPAIPASGGAGSENPPPRSVLTASPRQLFGRADSMRVLEKELKSSTSDRAPRVVNLCGP